MSRSTLVLLLAAGASLGCPRRGPTLEPPGDGATHSGSVAAPAPAPALPPWVRALLQPGVQRTYAWTYEVDTHGIEPTLAEAQGTLRCRADGPTRHALGTGEVAWVSCQACELETSRNDGFEPDFDACVLATSAGLWLVDAPPLNETELGRRVATPPYLPASPEPRREREAAEEDGFEHERWTHVEQQEREVLGRTVTAWCRNDGHTLMYGEDVTRCFAPGFGLVVLEWNGRSGPSTERYSLVAIDPPPP